MENLLTGEELERRYYDGTITLNTLSLEDLIVLLDYLSDIEPSEEQLELLEECLKCISNFDGYQVDQQAKDRVWNKIISKCDEPQQGTSKPKIKMTKYKRVTVSLIASVVAVLGISTVVCSANNANLLSLVFNKEEGIISVGMENSVEVKEMTSPEDPCIKKYLNMESFKSYHNDVPILNYIPNGYGFLEASYFDDDETIESYTIDYSKNGKFISYSLSVHYSDNGGGIVYYDVDENSPREQYVSNGHTYFICDNYDSTVALCVEGNREWSVSTDESVDELKKMIDSIG